MHSHEALLSPMSILQHQKLPFSVGKEVDDRVLQSSQTWSWRDCHSPTSLSSLPYHHFPITMEDKKHPPKGSKGRCALHAASHSRAMSTWYCRECGVWLSQWWSCQWLFHEVAYMTSHLTFTLCPLTLYCTMLITAPTSTPFFPYSLSVYYVHMHMHMHIYHHKKKKMI